jgi:hypothetical protein
LLFTNPQHHHLQIFSHPTRFYPFSHLTCIRLCTVSIFLCHHRTNRIWFRTYSMREVTHQSKISYLVASIQVEGIKDQCKFYIKVCFTWKRSQWVAGLFSKGDCMTAQGMDWCSPRSAKVWTTHQPWNRGRAVQSCFTVSFNLKNRMLLVLPKFPFTSFLAEYRRRSLFFTFYMHFKGIFGNRNMKVCFLSHIFHNSHRSSEWRRLWDEQTDLWNILLWTILKKFWCSLPHTNTP